MKISKIKVFKSQAETLMKELRFSNLDINMQNYINNEIFYFNNRRIVVIAWMILVIEILNVLNVLIFSKSGLTTLNNCQYFAMYLLMFVSGTACLIVRHFLQERKELLVRCYVGFTLCWMVWHAVLTAMDLRRNPSITVFVTAMFGFAFLLRLKPREAICILPGSFLVLILCVKGSVSSGIVINAAIVTLVSVLISCSRYFSTLEEMGYRQKMIVQADHRIAEKQELNFLREQQRILLTYSSKLIFLWNRELDHLTFSNGTLLSNEEKQELHQWLDAWSIMKIQKNQYEQFHTYRIEVTPQTDSNGILTGAVGRLICQSEAQTK